MSSLSSDKQASAGGFGASFAEIKKIRLRLFLFGTLLGAVCFLAVYGAKILNPTYDDWLLLGDMDLRQHYIGFCHFRQSRWQFPIGLIETLSYPKSMSVIYTDSIPILAVLFKLFAYVLPVRFQYFGLAGLISFMLMGGLSCLLLARFCDNKIAIVIYSIFFILSYPVIQRMYYHTALAAQWILILALDLWFYQEELAAKRRVVYWSLMGFLCVSIHSYFLPMTGLILAAAAADTWIAAKDKKATAGDHAEEDRKRSDGLDEKKAILTGLYELAGFCATAILSLFIYGGFYGGTSAVGDGLGSFSSNLNTFINPLHDGKLYGELPLYYGFQYEGFGYLGGGILLLLILGIVCTVTLSVLGYVKPMQVLKGHRRLGIAGGVFVIFCALAIFPIVTFNDVKVFGVPYPGAVKKFLGIFRSNGRFIWTAVYLLELLATAGTYRL